MSGILSRRGFGLRGPVGGRADPGFTVDMPLLTAILMLLSLSLVVIYSAGGESTALLTRQSFRIGFALCLMLVFSRVSPDVSHALVTLRIRFRPAASFHGPRFWHYRQGCAALDRYRTVSFPARRDHEAGSAHDGGLGHDPLYVCHRVYPT